MGVDEDFEAMLLAQLDELFDVLDVLEIINSRARMFECLPADYEADEVESPVDQLGEIMGCMFQSQWMANKGNITVFEEQFGLVGPAIWFRG